MVTTSKELQEQYDAHYSDNTEEWRKIGARGKVENILELSQGLKLNKILDVGAGDGNVLQMLSERNYCEQMYAVEISSSAIEQMQKKNIPGLQEIKQFDGYELDFEDNSFDLALCSHVIEHVEYPRKLLQEIKRVSKKQLLEVPIDFSHTVDQKFKHFHAYGHINIYTPALFNFLLYTLDFEILKSKRALYRKEAVKFENPNFNLQYVKVQLKRFIWQNIPYFMKIKPNTYTVLTQ